MVYRKRRSYRPRKRKFLRKRRMGFRRRSQYDAVVKRKIHAAGNIAVNAAESNLASDIVVNWGSTETPTKIVSVNLSDCVEHTQYSTIFREYRLTGIKIQLLPGSQINSTADTGIFEGHYRSLPNDTGSYADEINEFFTSEQYKMFSFSRPFKRYLRIGKYWWSKGEKWQLTSDPYPPGCSHIRFYPVGYTHGNVIGKYHITFYVQYRGAQPSS